MPADPTGSAYVFTKPDDGWVSTSTAAKLTASDGADDDYFGYSVAVDVDTVVVGAYGDDDNGSDSGSAYLFTKPATGWATATETGKLTASDGADDDYFGHSVAVDGDAVVMGAHGDDDKGSNSGSAHLYEVSGWTGMPDIPSRGTNATSYTVTGLTNDAEYNFWILATNSVGASPASDAVMVTPINTAPTAVDDTAAAAENTSVDINVTDNDTDPDFGPTLSVTAVTPPSHGTSGIASGSTTTVTYTPDADFTGTDSFDYTLSDGIDTDTGTVTVIVRPVPDKPTELVATSGDRQLTLNWTDPGNSDIIEYQYSTDGGTTFAGIPGSSATTTSYTVTGLSTGAEYTIAVRAVNANGNGAVATVTATTLFAAPANLVAAPDSSRIVLQWDTGDSAITHYLISSEITDGSGEPPPDKLVTAKSGTRTTAGVTSLTNGTVYTFTVRAAEVSGGQTVIVGLRSSVTAMPTEVVPAPPTNLIATPGDGQVRVTWDNPNNITIRKYQYSTDGGTTFNHMTGSNRNTTSFTFTGLTNGEPYTLGIRASNLSGERAPTTIDVNQPADTTGPRVSNIGKSNNGTADVAITPQAQSFTAGWNTDGYPLGSIELVAVLSSPPSETGPVAVTVRADDGSGNPSGTVLYTLNGPADIVTGVLTFTAPANAHLDPHTRYWVHITSTGLNINTPKWRTTNSNAEDSGAYPGWSIGNDRRYRPLIGYGSLGSWTTRSEAIKMRVNTCPSPV